MSSNSLSHLSSRLWATFEWAGVLFPCGAKDWRTHSFLIHILWKRYGWLLSQAIQWWLNGWMVFNTYLVPAVSVFRLHNRLVDWVVLEASDHVRHNEVVAAGPCRRWYQDDVLPLARMLVRLVHLCACVVKWFMYWGWYMCVCVCIDGWVCMSESAKIWYWRWLVKAKTMSMGEHGIHRRQQRYIRSKQNNCYSTWTENRETCRFRQCLGRVTLLYWNWMDAARDYGFTLHN